ncbi:MAG: leucine--tRNA ligase [Candidatus Aenigmarchaeota archaeon]|nr:leucine--tRNA ligase [Candidatus Aenigmarchaeota archaeon]
MKIDLKKIEKKWQKRWEKAKIFEADLSSEKKKFFITVPYPYTSGSLHIGHGRTYTIGDIIARFIRMKGFNVLWPMAFHISGTPVIGISKQIEAGEKEVIELFKEYVSFYVKDKSRVEKIVKSFVEPWNIVKFFSKVISKDFKALGFSIDWRRSFTTGDKEYNKFIEWQFQKLREKGYITQGSYPILFCPSCDSAVGEDDIAEGDIVKPKVGEYVLIKFKLENCYLVAATLRPETIFGITNLWINPEKSYVKVKVDKEIWIVSEDCIEKLERQNKEIAILEKIKGEKLIGKKVITPIIKKEVIVLPANFVDVEEATGVVYSVPAHAPWDWIGLKHVKESKEILKKYGIFEVEEIKPISMIEVKGYGEFPAIEECEKLGAKSLADKEKINEATQAIYRAEFYNGVLKEICREYKGLTVQEAKEIVFEDLKKLGMADKLYEVMALEKPVMCRCGEKVTVAVLEDQWFIDYGNEEWKKLARECLGSMAIHPEIYRKLFEDTIEWLHERPCARKRGVGTLLPWDKNYIIESLSDSTIYMCFYTIIHHIKSNKIRPEQLSYEFWDYVLLGNGDLKNVSEVTGIKEDLIKRMREEFLYWYPNDHRHTAIGHITNHLTFFIFNHAAIFPKNLWPKKISLNEYVVREGAKMSKSKGNVIPLGEIPEKYGADLFRLYVASSANLSTVMDWREEDVISVRRRLERFFELVGKAKRKKEIEFNKLDCFSKWFVSSINKKAVEATSFLENLEIQKYIQKAFFEILNDTNYYVRRIGKAPDEVLSYLSNIWVRLLAPVVPHICEELWEMQGNKSYISTDRWPEVDKEMIDEDIIKIEECFSKTIEDLRHVLKLTGKKKIACIYVVSDEELKYFSDAKKFLEKEFDFEDVKVFSVKDPKKYDPQNKSSRAKYGRPGIYLE